MIKVLQTCLLIFCFFFAFQESFGQTAGELSRNEKWRDDLTILSRELPQRHKNLFFHLSKNEFNQAIANLEAAIPRLSDAEMKLELWRLATKIGDAHTRIQYSRTRTFPISLYQFSDGTFVAGVLPEQRNLLKGQLLRIGNTSIEQAKAAIRQVIPAENESWFNANFPYYLTDPTLLVLLKILETDQEGVFTFRSVEGDEFSTTLKPVSSQGLKWFRPIDTLTPLPLLYKNPDLFYWHEFIPETRTLYVNYRLCREMPNKPFGEFAAELWKTVAEQNPERLVIDLRLNTGGNSTIFMPFIKALKKHKSLNKKGKILVLIGRSTFSSGYLNALTLKKMTKAILAGEPTGQKPNAYGEIRSFTLPHSKLVVTYSTKYFKTMKNDPPSLEPDKHIDRSSSDYSNGKDPVLDWAMHYR